MDFLFIQLSVLIVLYPGVGSFEALELMEKIRVNGKSQISISQWQTLNLRLNKVSTSKTNRHDNWNIVENGVKHHNLALKSSTPQVEVETQDDINLAIHASRL